MDLQGLGGASSSSAKAAPSLAVEIVAPSKTNPHLYQAKVAGSDQTFNVMLPQKNVAPGTAVMIHTTQVVLPQVENPVQQMSTDDQFVVSDTGGERLFQFMSALSSGKGELKLSREDQKMLETAFQVLKELPPTVRNELLGRIQTALENSGLDLINKGNSSAATPEELARVIRTIMNEIVESLPAVLQKTPPENRDRALKLLTNILFPSSATPPSQTGVGPLRPALDEIMLPYQELESAPTAQQPATTGNASPAPKQSNQESIQALPPQVHKELSKESFEPISTERNADQKNSKESVVTGEKTKSILIQNGSVPISIPVEQKESESPKTQAQVILAPGSKQPILDGKQTALEIKLPTFDDKILVPAGKNVVPEGKNVTLEAKQFDQSGKPIVPDIKSGSTAQIMPPLLEKTVAAVATLDKTMPLHLVNYEPIAVENESPALSTTVPVGRYLKIADAPSLPAELQRFMATRFPAISQVADMPSFLAKIAPESFELKESTLIPLEKQLQAMPESQRKSPFVTTAVQAALVSLTNPKSAPFFERIISQIEPVQTTISRLESIVEQVKTYADKNAPAEESVRDHSGGEKRSAAPAKLPVSFDLPAPLKESVERLESAITQAGESFSKLFSPESLVNKIETADSIKKMGDLWGMFLEGSLKKWSDGESRPELTGIKQELKRMNHLITKELVIQAVPGKAIEDAGFKTFLKELGKSVTESIHRIDGGQILSEPNETPKDRSQMIWIPVQIGQEWTRMGIEFRREKGKKGRGDSLANRVAISLELKKMGTVSAELDLDINKQLRVKIGTGSAKALQWFNDHREEIVRSLQSEKLRAVFVSINAVRTETEPKKPIDSFRVTG